MAGKQATQAQLSYELAIYKEQISMIKRETERISLTTIDLGNALKTVENVRADRVLIPIGGGAMVKGELAETRVLVPVGAQYLIEMDSDNAAVELKKRIDSTKKAVEKLNDEFTRIATKLREVTAQLQQMQMESKLSDRVDDNIRDDYI